MNISDFSKNTTDYCGDGVYLGVDRDGLLWLYTTDGINITNQIHLEDDTVFSILKNIRKYGYKDIIRG